MRLPPLPLSCLFMLVACASSTDSYANPSMSAPPLMNQVPPALDPASPVTEEGYKEVPSSQDDPNSALDAMIPAAGKALLSFIADVQGRRKESPWELAAPALLIGGTVAALLLAALGALAGKALLSSILAAALSAIQLARPPPGGQAG